MAGSSLAWDCEARRVFSPHRFVLFMRSVQTETLAKSESERETVAARFESFGLREPGGGGQHSHGATGQPNTSKKWFAEPVRIRVTAQVF